MRGPTGAQMGWEARVGVCGCVCGCVCLVALCLTLCDPMNCSLPGSSVHGISQARIPEWLLFPPPRDLLNPGIESESPASPAMQADSFTAEPPEGKPWEARLLLVEIFTTSPKPSLCKERLQITRQGGYFLFRSFSHIL